ncbi:AraC family transcriptional regulator [Zongyangia hominis]|uniref:AraC family transcriptional regulator n=1 Tax=Zongyangia hominis TaxID=2763677 RepID=A0A926ICL4_9FIRM|nr:AraC family transcriptional regulator [Zongyangia hominis]MBC8571245.1 AraC family transcriptional regulator [Zongyangia hominis]
MYKQKQSPYYDPFVTRIPTPSFELIVNYMERHDETTAEFPHTHTSCEIYYALEGEVHLSVEGEIHAMSPGDFAFLPPETTHRAIYEPGLAKKYFVIIFDLKEHAALSKQGEDTAYAVLAGVLASGVCFGRDHNNAQKIFEEICREIVERPFGWEMMLQSLYLQLILSVMRNIVPGDGAGKRREAPNLAIEITKYIYANYDRDITLQDIADALYISPRHISRLFYEYFGTSFAKTLSIYRLNYAKNYLCDTDLSVEEIAPLVGFATPNALYRLFREMEGMSVSEYRQQYRTLAATRDGEE